MYPNIATTTMMYKDVQIRGAKRIHFKENLWGSPVMISCSLAKHWVMACSPHKEEQHDR